MSENFTTPEEPNASDYALPHLSKETCDSLAADVQEQGIRAVMKQAQERLSNNNPELSDSVGSFAIGLLGADAPPRAVDAVHSVMVMTHELLRRQSESDALGRMLTPPTE